MLLRKKQSNILVDIMFNKIQKILLIGIIIAGTILIISLLIQDKQKVIEFLIGFETTEKFNFIEGTYAFIKEIFNGVLLNSLFNRN